MGLVLRVAPAPISCHLPCELSVWGWPSPRRTRKQTVFSEKGSKPIHLLDEWGAWTLCP